jgi:N-acetylglucosamine-6-sulfatase
MKALGAGVLGLSLMLLATLTEVPSVADAGETGALVAQRRVQPNIILITTDDQTLSDMSVMSKVRQRLGKRGTTFANAFSPYPLCCPARATLLTGQYAQNHHVLGNQPPWGGFAMFDDSNTLPLWLQQAGYRTMILGKYLNGYPQRGEVTYVPPGWDEWRVPVKKIYNYRHWTQNENGVPVAHDGYQTDFVADEASELIRRYSGDTPFFLWAGFLAPHWGSPRESDDPARVFPGYHVATPNIAKKYRDTLSFLPLPDKASINEKDVSDKPEYVRNSQRYPVALLRELNQQRLESLLSVDDAVSRILGVLKAQSELANTVIIFTSDNGYLIGEHRRIGKIIGYEESVRVPLIVAGPGFNTGATRNQKVSLVDVASTIAAAAGVTPQLLQDGVPLQTFASHPNAKDTRAMLFQAGPAVANPVPDLSPSLAEDTDRLYVGIRTKRYVYLEYATGERELYDLRSDPEQLVNMADRPEVAGIQDELATALERLRTCAGVECLRSSKELARR